MPYRPLTVDLPPSQVARVDALVQRLGRGDALASPITRDQVVVAAVGEGLDELERMLAAQPQAAAELVP